MIGVHLEGAPIPFDYEFLITAYYINVNFRIIMSSPSPEDDKVSFEEHPDANPKSREKGLKRFQMNPEPNWGPKNR